MATTEQTLASPALALPAGAGQAALAQSAVSGLPALAGGRGGALAESSPAKIMSALSDIFQQPAMRKAMPAIIVLVALVIFGALYAWTQETPYRAVFPGMAEADQQSTLETLKAGNYNARIDPSSGQIMVPSSRYHEARILLASQGIPRTQGRGILESLKDHSALTTSQFMEQAKYGAAIEQELAKSITQIATIRSARVHLAQPKLSAFVRERAPVKASVIVTPHSGRLVSLQQVQAIVHLVASSVPYLVAEDVSVVDNLGSLISRSPAAGALGLTTLQAEHKAQVEHTYRQRIVELLEPVVGEGNVRAQVNLVMNFTQVETAIENYDSQKEGSKTRSEALSEERGIQLDPQGIPGALTNRPPAESKSTPDTNTPDEKKNVNGTLSSKSTRNYELDKTVRHVKNSMGGIERVSVAVVIKERDAASKDASAAKGAASAATGYKAEELERLSGLVRGVVGFSQERGDAVNLMAAKFESVSAPAPAWYENDMALNGVKVLLATLVLMVILLTVVRPVLRSYFPPPAAPAVAPAALPPATPASEDPAEGSAENDGAAEGEDTAMSEGESIEDFKARLKKSAAPKKSSISADMLDTANTYDDKVALIRMLVQEDSGRVANVLKNMIKRDMG